MLFVSLCKADQTADQPTVIAVQFDELFLMQSAAIGNAVMRPYLIIQRHHLMSLCCPLTTMIPTHRDQAFVIMAVSG